MINLNNSSKFDAILWVVGAGALTEFTQHWVKGGRIG